MATLEKIVKTENGNIGLQIAESIINPSKSLNVLQLMNKSNEKFTSGTKSKTWAYSKSAADVVAAFETISDINGEEVTAKMIDALEVGMEIEVMQENFKAKDESGKLHPIHIQVIESIHPTSYQTENKLKAAKQIMFSEKTLSGSLPLSDKLKANSAANIGKAVYFVKDGNLIYRNFKITTLEIPNHVFITDFTVVAAEEVFGTIVPVVNAEAVTSTVAA